MRIRHEYNPFIYRNIHDYTNIYNHIQNIIMQTEQKQALETQIIYKNAERNQMVYPKISSDIRGVSIKIKSKMLKAELQEKYPKAKWSIRTEYYSGGCSIQGYWKGGGEYPYGASQIADKYQDSGKTDCQSDYFDYDNYCSVHDGSPTENKTVGYSDPQTLSENKAARLHYWISQKLEKVDYNELHNWSWGVAKEFVSSGKIQKWVGMTSEHVTTIEKTIQAFQDQHKKESLN